MGEDIYIGRSDQIKPPAKTLRPSLSPVLRNYQIAKPRIATFGVSYLDLHVAVGANPHVTFSGDAGTFPVPFGSPEYRSTNRTCRLQVECMPIGGRCAPGIPAVSFEWPRHSTYWNFPSSGLRSFQPPGCDYSYSLVFFPCNEVTLIKAGRTTRTASALLHNL